MSKLGKYEKVALTARLKFAIFDTVMSLKLNVYKFCDQKQTTGSWDKQIYGVNMF